MMIPAETMAGVVAESDARLAALRAENTRLRDEVSDLDALRAERDQLREALGMAEVQQHEVAKALRLEPSGDSVYLHYQIMAVLDAVRLSLSAEERK